MPSYDITCKANWIEIKNAVEQAQKEVKTRFDFKNTSAAVEQGETALFLYADNDFQLRQVSDLVTAKLAKRGVDLRFLQFGDEHKVSGGKLKQEVKVKEGIDDGIAKKIIQTLKTSKIKVQGSIQGDSVRVTGNKRDDLQASIKLIETEVRDSPFDFGNFRD